MDKKSTTNFFLILFFLVSCTLGCASNGALMDPIGYFDKKNPEEYAQYGPSPVERREKIQAMGNQAAKMSPPEQEIAATELAKKITFETDPLLRIETAKALGNFNSDVAFQGLKKALYDNDPDVKIAAIRSMATSKNPQAIPELGDVILRESNIDVRIEATKALGKFESPASKEALVGAIEDRDPALRYAGINSLKRMSDVDYGGDLVAWKEYAQGGTPNPESAQFSIVDQIIPSFLR